jgi:low affinity Fe/Cu permease
MSEKVALEIDINAKGATTSLGQLEEEAERLNEELRKVPMGTKAFNDLKTELIGVNKQIKNTELSMEALDNEQVASELGSVAGAVGDVSAAFVLLGGGGGALEETVQRIEKAIGVSMAFKGVIEGTQSGMKLFNNVIQNSSLIQKANTIITQTMTVIMKALGITVNTTSRSFNLLKGAIVATGIGALVIAIGFAIQKIMEFTSATEDSAEAQAKLNEELRKNREEMNKIVSTNQNFIDRQIQIVKNEEKIKDLQKKGGDNLKQINELTKENISLELQNLRARLASTNELLTVQEKIDLKTKIFRKEQELARLDIIKEAEATKDNVVHKNNLNKELLKELDTKKDIANISFPEDEEEEPILETDFLEKTEQATKLKTKVKIEGIQNEIEQEKQLKLQQLAWDEENVIEKAILDGVYTADQKLAIETDFQRKREAVIDDADQKILANQKAVEAAKIDLAVQGIGALMNLTSAFAKDNEKSQRRAFEINKKLQIAQAIMQTYQGANAIFASAAANPGTILFPAQPFIAAGIAIANGLANVVNISKQQFQTSSPGGGGQQTPTFGGGGGGTPPTLQPANTSTLVPQNQTQVFVTETDITNTQNQVSVIQGQATF